jgi:DNA-directed RNA polymerase subunit M/transcription elongation factor TFIIS
LRTASDITVAKSLLADPRLERLLTIGKEMNDLLSKISAANSYLAKEENVEESEAVELARNQLVRDLSREFAEARTLLPSLDDIATELQDQQRDLEVIRKMNVGLAKIEGLNGSKRQRHFSELADSTKMKITEIDNLMKALEALQADLSTSRRVPHVCPRCSTPRISYRIMPSELGFTLFRCDQCGNAWKITRYTFAT